MTMSDIFGLLAVGSEFTLAFVLLSSGVSKVRHREAFHRTLLGHGLGAKSSDVVAILVPAMEMGIGVAWLIPGLSASAGLATIGILAFFSGFLWRQRKRPDAPSCGCGGVLRSTAPGWNALARNAALAVYAVAPLAFEPVSGGLAALATTAAPVVVTATLLLLLTVLALDDLLAVELRARRSRQISAVANRLEVSA
jgi:hypothetical protein